MSIASELTNLEGNIEDSYDAVNDMGGIIPAQRNMDNLDQAIRTIPQNTGATYTAGYGIDIDQNDEISVDTTVIAEKTDIPTATSDLTNDSGFITSADLPTKTSDLTNDGSDGNSTYVEADDLATVATSGSYNDLSNTPTIPAAQVNSDWDANSGVAQILNKPTLATVATSGLYTDLTGTPSLATVATSGSYNDLSNTPTIPAAQVNSDWNSTSGVSQILNRPGIKNATAATHTDYNNNQDYLPNMRFLSFWNGAYNSSGNSNISHLANSCIGTNHFNNWSTANTTDTWVPVANGNNIYHRVIKPFNSDGSIPKSAMHGLPCPDYSTVITAWGTINSTSTKTMAADGYIVGKALVTGADKQAFIEIGGKQVAGIPYNATSQVSNLQVAFCIPVKSGTSVKFQCSGGTNGYFQGCNLVGWQM